MLANVNGVCFNYTLLIGLYGAMSMPNIGERCSRYDDDRREQANKFQKYQTNVIEVEIY